MSIFRITNYIDTEKRAVVERTDIKTDETLFFGQVDLDMTKLGISVPVPIQFPLKTSTLERAFQAYDDAAAQAAEDTFAEYEQFKADVAKREELAAVDKVASKILGPLG